MMKRILVTGATGFIGNYVIRKLLQKGYDVIATSASPEKAAAKDWFPAVKYIPFDFSHFDDHTDYYEYFGKPALMIHLAWEGLPHYKEAFHIDINLPRHYAFLNNMIRNGLKDLTVTGTCFEYGMKEGMLSEEMASEPANPYAVAKNELRKRIEVLSRQNGVSLKWIRLFYMYGQGQHPHSLLSQLDKALGKNDAIFNMSGGEQVRDYLPADTVTSRIAAIALQQTVTGIINCCSGQPVSIKELVLQYLHSNGKHIRLNLGHYPYADYEPMSFWGDIKKMNSALLQYEKDKSPTE